MIPKSKFPPFPYAVFPHNWKFISYADVPWVLTWQRIPEDWPTQVCGFLIPDPIDMFPRMRPVAYSVRHPFRTGETLLRIPY